MEENELRTKKMTLKETIQKRQLSLCRNQTVYHNIEIRF